MSRHEPHGRLEDFIPRGRQAPAKGRGTERMESRPRLETYRNPTSFQEERMATSPSQLGPQEALEDPLAHLPCSTIVEFRKGQTIYNSDQRSSAIYLVIEGRVKVARRAPRRGER